MAKPSRTIFVVFATLVWWPSTACADLMGHTTEDWKGTVAGGLLLAIDSNGVAPGFELSYTHYLEPLEGSWPPIEEFRGIGGFFQLEDARGTRLAYGVQGHWSVVGLELGMAQRLRDGRDDLRLHVAPFVSLGVVSLAVRVEPAIRRSEGHPVHAAAVATFKFPYPFR